MKSAKRYKFLFKGNVQGIFFRQGTREKAEELGLKGTVRNLEDGSVEIIVEGDANQIRKLYKFCKEEIKGAFVTDVKKEEQKPTGKFDRFFIRY